MQKFKSWLFVAIAFSILPLTRVSIGQGGLFDDWTQIFLLPIALLMLYVAMYLVGLILGIALLSINIIISFIIFSIDDGFGLYEFLCKVNKENFALETLSRPLKNLLIKYWNILRKNKRIEKLISLIITLFVLIYLLWCWGILKF